MAEEEMTAKRGSGTAKPGRFCDEDCNNCHVTENSQLMSMEYFTMEKLESAYLRYNG